jgi:hypothetical protein
MNLRDYERYRRQIEDKYQADIAALDRVWAIAQSSASPRSELTIRSDGLGDAVKDAVQAVDGVFTKKTVTRRLCELDETLPPSIQNVVGGILKKMSEAGEIKMQRLGKGKRATEYIRNSSTNGVQPQIAVETESAESVELPATIN